MRRSHLGSSACLALGTPSVAGRIGSACAAMLALVALAAPALFALSTPAAAQDAGMHGLHGPASELASLDGLIGTWQGSGVVRAAAEAPETKWTADLCYGRILGGHFVHEDMRVEFEGGAMPPLQMQRFYGFDRETRRYVGFAIDNMGTVESNEVFVLAGNVMVTMSTSVDEGGPSVERGTVRWSEDHLDVNIERGEGASGFYTHVKGSFARRSAEPSAVQAVAGAFMAQPHGEMLKLQSATGTYQVEGRMRPSPDGEWIAITGTDRARLIWGGTVLEDRVLGAMPGGKEGDFEGLGFMTWSPRERAYVNVWMENAGAAVVSKARWVDGALVFTAESMMHGLPTVGRNVLELDASGAFARYTSDMVAGRQAPMRSFEARYTKKAGAGAGNAAAAARTGAAK